jgi:DNA repair protein RecO
MSHHKHTTEAFVLAVKAVREGDARVKLVTKDGEVLSVIATGLRLLKSKLRMAVVPYASLRVSIVRGKDVWRLTNAEPLRNFYYEIKSNPATAIGARKALARTASLCEKLTPGEGVVGNLFQHLVTYADNLAQGIAEEKIKAYETHVALRILSELGYMEDAGKWNDADIAYIESHMLEAVKDVNHGIASADLA